MKEDTRVPFKMPKPTVESIEHNLKREFLECLEWNSMTQEDWIIHRLAILEHNIAQLATITTSGYRRNFYE